MQLNRINNTHIRNYTSNLPAPKINQNHQGLDDEKKIENVAPLIYDQNLVRAINYKFNGNIEDIDGRIEEIYKFDLYKKQITQLYSINILNVIKYKCLDINGEQFFRCALKFDIPFPDTKNLAPRYRYLVDALKCFHEQRFADGASIFKRKADSEANTDAMVLYGDCCIHAIGVTRNAAAAISFYQKAAEKWNINAMVKLSHFYSNGIEVSKNEAWAAYLVKAAVDKEGKNPIALNALGYHHYYGIGVRKDREKSLYLYRRARIMKYPNAVCGLADYFFLYNPDYNDEKRGISCYRKAISLGSISAVSQLAFAYFYGHGVKQNHGAAFFYEKMGLDLGRTGLLECLILRYEWGEDEDKRQECVYRAVLHNKNNDSNKLTILIAENIDKCDAIINYFAIRYGTLPKHVKDDYPEDSISREKLTDDELVVVLKNTTYGMVNCVTKTSKLLDWFRNLQCDNLYHTLCKMYEKGNPSVKGKILFW